MVHSVSGRRRYPDKKKAGGTKRLIYVNKMAVSVFWGREKRYAKAGHSYPYERSRGRLTRVDDLTFFCTFYTSSIVIYTQYMFSSFKLQIGLNQTLWFTLAINKANNILCTRPDFLRL